MGRKSSHGTLVLQPALVAVVAVALLILAFSNGGGSSASVGLGTVVVWSVLAVLLARGRRFSQPISVTVAAGLLALGLVAAWAALSLRWAADDGAAFGDLVRLLFYLGIFGLVGLLAQRGTGPSWLAGIALGGTVVALAALLSRALGFGGDEELARALPSVGERLSYPIGYWNALGYLMAMTIVPLVWLATRLAREGAQIAIAGSVPVALTLFLTSSRGAILAGLVGLGLVAWGASDRTRLLQTAIVAVPAWIAVVLLAAARRADLAAGAGLSGWALVLAVATLVAAGLAALTLGRRMRSLGAPDDTGLKRSSGDAGRRRHATGRVVIAAVVAAIAVAAIGPRGLIGEFRTETVDGDRGAAAALASGSGRLSFWGAALEAFGQDPLRGVGAGGYESYWTANARLPVPARNAHSAPLETLAELGLPGGLALVAFLFVPLLAAARTLRSGEPEPRAAAAAAAGVFAAGLIAIAIDWSWEVPATMAPMLIAGAALCGTAFRGRGEPAPSLLVDPQLAGYEGLDARPGLPQAPLRAGLLLVSVAAVGAAAVLAVSASQLERGADRLARGDVTGAAESARLASAIQPWSAEPYLLLAEVEEAARNLDAARRQAEEAVRRAPGDPRPWLLLSAIHLDLRQAQVASVYALRAVTVAPPELLGRAAAVESRSVPPRP